MIIKSVTDIGATRKENQDNYWSALLNVDNSKAGVVCMCDGMGGLSNGGLASSIIVKSVRESILDGVDFSEIRGVIEKANESIYKLSESGNKMGTTCTLLYCQDGKYEILHVGDSRCYMISHSGIMLLTSDHSVINQYGITPENNADLYEKYKSKLTRCLGVKPNVNIDKYKGNYEKGDMFLLCSDGFWHYFESSGYNINIDNLEECVQNCIKVYGETDNISVSLLYT